MTFPFTFAELASVTGGRLSGGDPSARPARLVVDSRSVRKGDCFVALKGGVRDGHSFVKDALTRGAAGLVVSDAVAGSPPEVACLRVPDTLKALQQAGQARRRRSSVRVTGITGSNGKTTTKEMLAHVLAASGRRVLATRGNLNSQIGLPLMLLELEEGHTHAVLEMGASQKGEIARLASLAEPGVGVITNVGQAHLEFFGSLEGVLEAKWELAAFLPKEGLAILNADDPRLMARGGRLACSVATFGFSERADVRAENVRQDPETVFDLMVGGVRRETRLPVPGLFNVSNALAAAAVAAWEGIPVDAIVQGLASFVPPPLRMQVRERGDGVLFLLDAYNANPSSMSASLDSFARAYSGRRKVAVLGSMKELGPATQAEHALLGERLASLALDGVYFLGGEGAWVREGFSKAGGRGSFEAFETHEALRAALEKALAPGTAVLFKASRGVQLEKVFEPLLQEKG